MDAKDVIYNPAGAGVVPSTVESKLRTLISVKDFGAVGDGAADDTLAIKNALAAAPNGIVYMPPGIYKTTDTLHLQSNQQLVGAGMGFASNLSTLVSYFGNGTAIQTDGAYSRLADFMLWDNGNGRVGIYLGSSQNMLERVTVMPNKELQRGFKTAGVQTFNDDTTQTTLCRRVYIYGNTIGFDASRGTNVVIEGSYIQCNETNIRVGETSEVTNFVICGGSAIELFGKFEDSPGVMKVRGAESQNSVSIDVKNCRNFVCRDSYFEVSGGSGSIWPGQRAMRFSLVNAAVVEGNYFYGGGVSTAIIDIASEKAKGIWINGNAIVKVNGYTVEATNGAKAWQALFGANTTELCSKEFHDCTWVPEIAFDGKPSQGAKIDQAASFAKWDRSGSTINLQLHMRLLSKGSGKGNFGIIGLPLAISSDTIGSFACQKIDGLKGSLASFASAANQCIAVCHNGEGYDNTFVSDKQVRDDSALYINITYQCLQ